MDLFFKALIVEAYRGFIKKLEAFIELNRAEYK
jgi:hypothetical protein